MCGYQVLVEHERLNYENNRQKEREIVILEVLEEREIKWYCFWFHNGKYLVLLQREKKRRESQETL